MIRRVHSEDIMYGLVIASILLFPWTLVAVATFAHLRSRRVGIDYVAGAPRPPTSIDRHHPSCYHKIYKA